MKEIKFEDIQKANESIKTTDIKGKEYAEVNQRIKAFRMLYPDGFIKTEIENVENGICIIKANVGYYEKSNEGYLEQHILGIGTAYEKENSSFINKTSYIENCETSAVGRALGMAGFGIDTSIASAEEVENAILQQDEQKLISKTQETALRDMIKNKKIPNEIIINMLKEKGYEKIAEIQMKDYMSFVEQIEKINVIEG